MGRELVNTGQELGKQGLVPTIPTLENSASLTQQENTNQKKIINSTSLTVIAYIRVTKMKRAWINIAIFFGKELVEAHA